MRYFLVISMIILFGSGNAQSNMFYGIIPDSTDHSYEALLNFVEHQYEEKEDIAKFFYYWMASNISYNQNEANGVIDSSTSSQIKTPLEVFDSKTAVCSGYSSLYKLFLNEFDIECEVVNGYAKRKQGVIDRSGMLVNHSWNAVQLDGKWFLVDPTWASPIGDEPTISEYYFKTPPTLFLFNHFPEIPYWQLNDNPLSIEEFKSLPEVNASYFELGFDDILPKFEVYDDRFRLTIGASSQWKPVLLKSSLGKKYEPLRYRRKRKKGTFEFDFSLDEINSNVVRLDATKQLDYNTSVTQTQLMAFVIH
ncbi:transglutaminase domain-containing protein [Reichenbachiella sp.]|uniref:transglutaminase domain-containing protein n=1 Tax=Reichenbachiella sp. TaxID=2184521 RepID=UPI003BAF7C27